MKNWIGSSALGLALAVAALVTFYVVVNVAFQFTGPRTHTQALVAWSAFGVGVTLASRLLPATAAIVAGSALAVVGVAGVAGLDLPVATVEVVRVAGSEFTWIAAAVLLTGGLWEAFARSRTSSMGAV